MSLATTLEKGEGARGDGTKGMSAEEFKVYNRLAEKMKIFVSLL